MGVDEGGKAMTRTGYSCAFMRRKTKPSCPAATDHWCSEQCRYIDPMTCHVGCKAFSTIADRHKRPQPKTGVELL
jgi:hypothetical protein